MDRLIYKDTISRTLKNGTRETTVITIRLDDQCKNGHQDFSMTADIFENKRDVGGGCCHDHINAVTGGKYQIFIDLHLCDYTGVPVYAVENGFYHIKHETQETFLSYYPGITAEHYAVLVKAENKTEYAILLEELGIIKIWNDKAEAAIKKLEELTGQTFTVDSVKTNYHKPTDEEIADFRAKKAAGYYTAKAKAKRARQAERDAITAYKKSLLAEAAKKISGVKAELQLKLFILSRMGEKAAKNFIYYNHTNTVTFNRHVSYSEKPVTAEEYNKFIESLTAADMSKLPAGIKFNIKENQNYED